MKRPTVRPSRNIALVQLIPNMLTIAAICAGLTAIPLAVQGSFVNATLLIMLAGILDGIDGRIARFLRSDSKMGAELDSLADFVNFGVAPALLLYFWTLQDASGLGWIAVLVFAICCVVRLARFNIGTKTESACAASRPSTHFVGVPAPAGAVLVLLPIYVYFASAQTARLPDIVICLHLIAVGLAMISTVRTSSFKTMRISRENVKYLLVGFAVLAAAALTYFWFVLIVMCLAYVAVVLWGLLARTAGVEPKGH